MLVNILIAAVILLGIKTISTIKKESYPSVAINKVVITTLYHGASARDVEINVTKVIEEELEDVSSVKDILSTSQEGLSTITIEAEDDLTEKQFDKVYDEVGNALASINNLPTDSETPSYKSITTDDMGILEISLTGPKDALRKFVPYLEGEVKKVEGVSTIDRVGFPDEEYHILVDAKKANDLYLDLRQVSNALRKRNVEGSGGSLESHIGERQIVAYSKFHDVKDLMNTNIRRNFDGKGVRLKDIAKIERNEQNLKLHVRNNGEPGMSLSLKKKTNADMVDTIEKVRQRISEIELPEGVKLIYFNDKSEFTKSRISLLASNALMGMILVFAVLLFILDLKTAFWTAFSIPLSFLGAIIIIDQMGITFNSIALGGFVLVIGMLVDDAIVIAEQINSEKEDGHNGEEASFNAVRKVWLPILGASMTTIIAYSPLIQMGGISGKFIWQMPAVIAIALVASLIDTYILLPAHLAHGKAKKVEKKQFIVKSENAYRKILGLVKKFRYGVILVFIMLLASSVWVSKNKLKVEPFPQDAVETFTIQVTQPAGISPKKALKNIIRIEKIIQQLPKEELVGTSSRLGTHSLQPHTDRGTDTHLAAIFVYLTEFEKRDRLASAILEDLRVKINKSFADEGSTFVFELIKQGPPVGHPFEVRVASKFDNLRKKKVEEVKKYLATVSGVYDIEDNVLVGKPEVNLLINYDRIAELGVTVEDILLTIKTAFDGVIISNIVEHNESIDFRLRIDKKGVTDISYLKNLGVMNSTGNLIKFSRFITFEEKDALSEIYHIAGQRTTSVYGQLNKKKINPTKIMTLLEDRFKSDGKVNIEIAGEPKENEKIFGDLSIAALMAVFGIFLTISLILNSFTLPIIVMSAIPFAVIGIMYSAWGHGLDISMFVMMSVIGLAGIIVNDSIVMVFTIQGLLKEGVAEFNKVIEGAVSRLRPVCLTTITTVLGLLPTGYAIGGYDPFISPMCLTLAYGLLFGTTVVLILVPTFYFIKIDIISLKDKFIK